MIQYTKYLNGQSLEFIKQKLADLLGYTVNVDFQVDYGESYNHYNEIYPQGSKPNNPKDIITTNITIKGIKE